MSNVQLGSVRKIMEVSCKCFQRHVVNSFISQSAPSLFDKGNSGWFRNLGNKTQAINCLFGSQGGSWNVENLGAINLFSKQVF